MAAHSVVKIISDVGSVQLCGSVTEIAIGIRGRLVWNWNKFCWLNIHSQINLKDSSDFRSEPTIYFPNL